MIMVGAMHLARPGRNLRRKPIRVCGSASVKSPKAKFGWKDGSARKCADAELAEAGERRAALAELADSGFDRKKKCVILCGGFTTHKDTRKVKGK